jgi:hypothetical protein
MNGPFGVSVEPLMKEHVDLSRYSKRLPTKVVTVVGGGDSVAALGGLCKVDSSPRAEYRWRCHFGTLAGDILAWRR